MPDIAALSTDELARELRKRQRAEADRGLLGPQTIDLACDDHCSSMGRSLAFRVLSSPVTPPRDNVGYLGVPVHLTGLPLFAGVRCRITVEILGVDEEELPTANPFAPPRRKKVDAASVAAYRRTAKRIKQKLERSGNAQI